MKRVTEILRNEHRLIGRAAACLDRVADDASENDGLCVVTAIDLFEFFAEFADGAHQEKEERFVFPALVRLGMVRHPVRELLEDHEQERDVLQTMRRTLEGASQGHAASRKEFVRVAREYAALQLEHVDAEESILLPLVEEFLDERTGATVLAGFEQIDAALPYSPSHYGRLIEKAATRLGSSVLPTGVPDGTDSGR